MYRDSKCLWPLLNDLDLWPSDLLNDISVT